MNWLIQYVSADDDGSGRGILVREIPKDRWWFEIYDAHGHTLHSSMQDNRFFGSPGEAMSASLVKYAEVASNIAAKGTEGT